MKSFRICAFLATIITLVGLADAGPTSPPRGYDTWNAFGFHFNESMVLDQAHYLTTTLADGKYEYLILDEGWEHVDGLRDKWVLNDQGFPMPNIAQFPSAAESGTLAPLAKKLYNDYNMVLGLWLLRGITKQAIDLNLTMMPVGYGNETIQLRDIADLTQPCTWHTDVFALNMSNPWAQVWLTSMMNTYSRWGVGYFKVDCIFGPDLRKENIIGVAKAVSQTVNMFTGKQSFLSLSPGGTQSITQQNWIVKTLADEGVRASSYRVANDLHDCWANGYGYITNCVTYVAKRFTAFPGVMEPIFVNGIRHQSYPDGDMFPIGGFGLFGGNNVLSSLTKPHLLRFQLGLWNLVQSPAIISGNVFGLDQVPGAAEVVNNTFLVAIQQSGVEPRLLADTYNETLHNTPNQTGTYVWASKRDQMPNQHWIGFFAYDVTGNSTRSVNVSVPVVGLDPAITSFGFFEIFSGQTMFSTTDQTSTGIITFEVPVNDAMVFLAQPLSP